MGTTAEKLTYLNTTKGKIKDSINLTGAGITNQDTFRSYASKLKLGLINSLNDNGDTIYSNLEKVSGIGSNLSLTPTYEAPMRNREIYGNTLQDGTPTPSSPVPIQSVTGLQNVSIFKNNINNQGIRLGLYQIVDGNYASPSGANRYSTTNDLLQVQPNTTYTVTTKNNINAQFYELEYNSSKTYLNVNSSSNQSVKSYTFTTGANTYYIAIDIRAYDTTNYDVSYVGDIIIYDNNDNNTYEVNLGKNLLEPLKTSKSVNGVNIIANADGSITLYGTSTGGINTGLINPNNPPVLEAGTYTRSVKVVGTINKNGQPVILSGRNSDNANKMGDLNFGSDGIYSRTSTLEEKNTMSNINLYAGQGVEFDCVIYIQLEKGSQATSYSPYFPPYYFNTIGTYEDSIKKSTGKQLFDKDNANIINAIINGTTGDITAFNTCRTAYIQCKPNTNYAVSRIVGTRFIIGTTTNTPAPGMTCNQYTGNNTASSLSITTGANDNYLLVFYYNSGSDTLTEEQIRNSIMINEGSTALPYEPYGKVWYITKNIGEKIVEDNSGWGKSSRSDVNKYYIYNYLDYGLQKKDAIVLVCNYLNCVSQDQCDAGDLGLANLNGNGLMVQFALSDTDFDTLQKWKTFVGTYKPKVLYVLSTPVYEVITNTELIQQLETLYNAKSKNGTTNITITSEDLSMLLNVSVLKGE